MISGMSQDHDLSSNLTDQLPGCSGSDSRHLLAISEPFITGGIGNGSQISLKPKPASFDQWPVLLLC